MSRRRVTANTLKEQAGRISRGDVYMNRPHSYHFMREKPRPRYEVRGMKLAVRSLSQELRKVSAQRIRQVSSGNIRNCEPPKTLNVITEHSLITKEGLMTNPQSSSRATGILGFALCHGTNLAKTLSPEGVDDLIENDYGLQPSGPFRLMAQWYRRCEKEGYHDAAESLRNLTHHMASAESQQVSSMVNQCRCNAGSAVGGNIGSDPEFSGSRLKESSQYLGCWQHQGIQKDELVDFISENENFLLKVGMVQKIASNTLNKDNTSDKKWKDFLKNKQCTVYRKQLPSGIYEYRVHASFNDISASQLLRVNKDINYRKTWDDYVLDLKIVDSDPVTGSELVQWVTRCPYPFATREYIYLRRHLIDDVSKVMVLMQKATDATNLTSDPSIMRVETYMSRAIIKPHTGNFEESGCDYMLSYYDDPKMSLPTRMMDLATSRGIAESTKRMHQAALGLKKYDAR